MDFEDVYKELFTPLYRYIFLRTYNHDESIDIVQVVLIKLFEKYNNHSIIELNRLMYRVAKNEIIDRTRRKKPVYLDPSDTVFINAVDTNQKDVYQLYEQRELLVLVQEMIDQLDEISQQVMMLRFFEENEYSEIAHRLSKSETSIRQIVSRSLKKMSQYYESRNKNN